MFDLLLAVLSFALILGMLIQHAAWWMALMGLTTWLLVLAVLKVK